MRSAALGFTRNDWRHFIGRIVTHPAFEAIAVVALVLISVWILMDNDALHPGPGLPLLFGHK
jgi:hypothetical protein